MKLLTPPAALRNGDKIETRYLDRLATLTDQRVRAPAARAAERAEGHPARYLRVFVDLLIEEGLLEDVFLQRLLGKIVQLHRESERLLGDGLWGNLNYIAAKSTDFIQNL